MAAPVVLVEAAPRNGATAGPVTVRLAGGGALVPYRYGGQDWRAGLTALPKSVATLDFDEGELGGGGVTQAMQLSWAPATNAKLAELAALYWTDATVTVRIGPEDGTFTLPPIVTTGLVLEAPIAEGALTIALADTIVDLKRPLLVDRFAGTGDLEGPIEWSGLIKPRSWGRCFNVGGRVIDTAYNIWSFGDPTRPWQAFDKVRDSGVDASAITILAWQGSIAATLAALRAGAVTQGGCIACPSLACVRWWTVPAGDLKADIRGETDGGYVETAPQIAQRMVAARSTLAFAAGEVTAAVTARPMAFGWRVDNDNASAADQVSSVLADVSLSWMLVDGAIVFRRWEWLASTRSARSQSVTRRGLVKPVKGRKLGYRKNWSPMARGDLAALVFAQDVVYETGRSVADGIATAQLTADGKNKLFYADAPPLPAVSVENDRWQDTANGNREYQRLAGTGAIAMGGTTVTFGGTRIIYRPWAPRRDSGIAAAQADATTAIGAAAVADGKAVTANAAAATAQATADTSAARIAIIVSDSYLDASEKPAVKREVTDLSNEYAGLIAQAAANGVSSAAYATAYSALVTYLGTLTPAYTNANVDTPIVAATYAANFSDLYAARTALITASADKTSAQQVVIEINPRVVTIPTDYLGALPAGYSDTITPKVTRGGTDIRASADVTYALASSNLTATVDNTAGSAGKGSVTVTAVTSATGAYYNLTATVSGVAQPPVQVTYNKHIGTAPSSGGAGSKLQQTSTFTSISATTATAIVATMTVTLASGERLVGTAPLDYRVSGSTGASRTATAKWQYLAGGVWNDFAAAITGTTATAKSNSGGEGSFDPAIPGHGDFNQAKSGLSAAAYDCRLVVYLDSGGATVNFSGTATIEAKV